ncbi:hypothetical protein DH2020_028323 [Rehmannia glutinosa]|uniref:Uncharacterized protein n=1 Tax=Rehmannia glutinosa TaxID=99300 RepID=A0ABR0VVU7_REHGL
MLAKQAWRLATSENSLLAQALKARYFPNDHFLNANIGYNPSFTWRSILVGKELLQKGIRWRVGDGKTIRVWEDPWIPSLRNFRTSTERGELPKDWKVQHLMVQNSNAWDEDKIANIFSTEEAQAILQIPLRNTSGQDILTWAFTQNGCYSVKSGYHIARTCASTILDTAFLILGRFINQIVWKLKVPPKIQVFIWKAMHGILPTRANLQHRACEEYLLCERCHTEVETTEHVLRDCPWSQFYWVVSPLRMNNHILHTNHATIPDMIFEVSKIEHDEYVEIFVTLLCGLCGYAVNRLLFQGKVINHQDCVNLGMRCLKDFQQSQDPYYIPCNGFSPKKWTKSPRNYVKINTDASIRNGEGTGLGVAIRDHDGKMVHTLVRKLNHSFDIDIAEALACRECILLAGSLNLTHVEIETDYLLLGNGLCNGQENRSYFGSIIEDIQLLCSDFISATFKYIPRTANELAHKLARYAFVTPLNGFLSGSIPPDLCHIVNLEVCTPAT